MNDTKEMVRKLREFALLLDDAAEGGCPQVIEAADFIERHLSAVEKAPDAKEGLSE